MNIYYIISLFLIATYDSHFADAPVTPGCFATINSTSYTGTFH